VNLSTQRQNPYFVDSRQSDGRIDSFRLARNPGTIAIVLDGDSGGSALISDPVARTGALASGAVTRVSELACIEG
jgi:hypothetical protein